jgi:predicted O-methyltransferase YrrM
MDKKSFSQYYQDALRHQKEHACTGVPYEYGDVLSTLISAVNAMQILEVGTGTGYTTACILSGNRLAHVETIDHDLAHIELARKMWRTLGISEHVTVHTGLAEEVLPEIDDIFDVIFFDANTPQKKFITHFERLLRSGGLLITTNLFLKDVKGGKYLLEIQHEKKWKTAVFADTALSVKVG